jgi:hypothetical protein
MRKKEKVSETWKCVTGTTNSLTSPFRNATHVGLDVDGVRERGKEGKKGNLSLFGLGDWRIPGEYREYRYEIFRAELIVEIFEIPLNRVPRDSYKFSPILSVFSPIFPVFPDP